MSKDWSWTSEEAKESLVVKEVRAIVVYPNVNGDIVIRQEGALGEEDPVIFFPPEYADKIIAAIQYQAKAAAEAAED